MVQISTFGHISLGMMAMLLGSDRISMRPQPPCNNTAFGAAFGYFCSDRHFASGIIVRGRNVVAEDLLASYGSFRTNPRSFYFIWI